MINLSSMPVILCSTQLTESVKGFMSRTAAPVWHGSFKIEMTLGPGSICKCIAFDGLDFCNVENFHPDKNTARRVIGSVCIFVCCCGSLYLVWYGLVWLQDRKEQRRQT